MHSRYPLRVKRKYISASPRDKAVYLAWLSILTEFLSLSCGSPRDTSFIEKTTGIRYNSDAPFINTGLGRSIKPSLQANSPRHMWYLRYFPHGNRNCYTFDLVTGDKYLIRAVFLHGSNVSTSFQLHIGPNMWTSVQTPNDTNLETHELIHVLTIDRLQVCLVKTGISKPFISALELRKLNSSTYSNWIDAGSWETLSRKDVGSVSKQILRNQAVDFDRIWLPLNSRDWSKISTNQSKDIIDQVPRAVMDTASVPTDPYAPMEIPLPQLYPGQKLRVVMHFSNPSLNETRIFSVIFNGRKVASVTLDGIVTTSTSIRVIVENGPNFLLLQRIPESNFPPMVNAFEIYSLKVFAQKETDTKQVDAILKIKSAYRLNKTNWNGDPCSPYSYMWDGLNCAYGHDLPTIKSLNLSASGLTGEILISIANLTHLETLDLSNNNLTGSIPEFLAKLDSLRLINLSNNRLSGSVPTGLLHKQSVTLSIQGNPSLCYRASCASSSETSNSKKGIAISVSLAALLAIAFAMVYIIKRKRRRKLGDHPSIDDDEIHQSDTGSGNNLFTYEQLAQATGNFSSNNLIGQGGFGYVHKGVVEDGTEVAIKQLKAGSGQGESEFQAEIQIISRVHHRHLVSLLGYCIRGPQRLLVYEFVANSTLEAHLHERGRQVMEWSKRFKIALGSAKGLSYLHDDCNPKIIHRDIKGANILIDDSYEAKLADFGLAKYCSDNETHVSTRVMGTFGYLAPEYASTGRLTDKSDVFSFGVVLLELISGRRPIEKSNCSDDYESIVEWAKPLMIQALDDGKFDGFVDPGLEHDFDVSEMRRVITCAADSVQQLAKRRPTMSQIVRVLEGNTSCSTTHEIEPEIQETETEDSW